MPDTQSPTASLPGEGGPSDPVPQPGSSIGLYTLRSVLGTGGFGVVYEAEQSSPVRRRVALKIVKPGMDSARVVARFEAERQALAVMDHPCIARVFDGGVTPPEQGSRSYFVMELVRGSPITDHCDRQRLSIRERIELFIRVCEAVQHAHAKGVIHRDLKPSNVLVAEDDEHQPQPKVIDFGIAKALHQQPGEASVITQQGQLIGTPEYMSPEQAANSAGDIDTRSDVYSLGVILYELLTGRRPFDTTTLRNMAIGEIQRVIAEVEPPRPSARLASVDGLSEGERIASNRGTALRSLNWELRRDLDWVVMKCLEKDRARRYATAHELALELRRYLSNEPVIAGPPSVRYRLGKFVSRNRSGVIAAAAGLLLLLGGLGGTTFGLFAARTQESRARALADAEAEQRRLAEARALDLELATDFQAEQLGAIDAESMGLQIRDSILAASPESSREDLAHRLAEVNFTNIALGSLETSIFDRTLATIDQQFADRPLVRAELLQSAADALGELGLYAQATPPQRQALEIRRRELGSTDPKTLVSINNLGFLLQAQGKLSEAEPYWAEAVSSYRRIKGDDHSDTLTAISNMGFLLRAQGRLADAQTYYAEALAGYQRTLGEDHRNTLALTNNMGALLRTQGKLSESEPYFRRALEGSRRVLGDDHPETLASMNNLATVLRALGNMDEAEQLGRASLEGTRRVLGDSHPTTLAAMNNLGYLLRLQGKFDESEALTREALAGYRGQFGDDHPGTLSVLTTLAALLQARGDASAAETCFRDALAGRRRVLGDDHPDTLRSMRMLTPLLIASGLFEDAESLAIECEQRSVQVHGAGHSETRDATKLLVDLYRAWREADGTHADELSQWEGRLAGLEAGGAG